MTIYYELVRNLRLTFFTIIALLAFVLPLKAQKLPNKQLSSLWAPKNLKIDGKADEWNGMFQAYNHATDLYYTISNNKEFLYVIIQARDYRIARKIIRAGITVTISADDGKKNIENVSVTFPVFENGNKFFPSFYKAEDLVESKRKKILDSIIKVDNEKMDTKSKVIGVSGFKGLDSVISRYNEIGFKAKTLFNENRFYTCELAIPLQRVKDNLTINENIYYNIRINETTMHGVTINRDAMGKIKSMYFSADSDLDQAATDFSGVYNFAKIP